MDVWGWIAVYAVGLTLLQLLVYRYLLNSGRSLTRRVGTPFGDHEGERDASSSSSSSSWTDGSSKPTSDSSSSRPPRDRDGPAGRGSDPSSRGLTARSVERDHPRVRHPADAGSRSAEHDGRTCPHCGTVNEADATFSRCWNCTREL